MSQWKILDIPFPKVSFGEPQGEPQSAAPVDQAGASVDQDRALHKWVNDVRHWIMSGRASSPEEAKAMLAAKGCPFPDQVLSAYHITEGMQDMGLNEPNTPQQVTDPDPGVQPVAPAPVMPETPPDPELGLPTDPALPEGDTYDQQFADPNLQSQYPKYEDAEEDDSFYPRIKDEDEDEKNSHFTLTAEYETYNKPRPNSYDPDTTPFGNRLVQGPGGVLQGGPQIPPKRDKETPGQVFQKQDENDAAYIQHLVKTRGVTPEQADAILTEHARGNVTAGVQKGSPYPENSYENSPDHSAPGHNLPEKVNAIYNAVMRENPDYGKEKAMKIAWERSGLHKEKDNSSKDKESMTTGTYNDVSGRVLGSYVDVWGTTMARFATEFGTYEVPLAEIQPAEAPEEANPVAEIEQFFSEIDPPGATSASIDARTDNLNQIVQAVSKIIGKASVTDQIKLDEMALSCRLELGELRQSRKLAVEDSGQAYLDTLPQLEGVQPAAGGAFSPGGSDGWLDQVHQDMEAEAEGVDFDKLVAEQPEMLVNDMPDAMVSDQGGVQNAARDYVSAKTAGLKREAAKEILSRFLERVELVRRGALANRKTAMTREASTESYDGPDEGLFLR